MHLCPFCHANIPTETVSQWIVDRLADVNRGKKHSLDHHTRIGAGVRAHWDAVGRVSAAADTQGQPLPESYL